MEYLECLREGHGYAECILGPMFSSKSATLLSIIRRYRHLKNGVSVVLYRAVIARTEDKGMVKTHSGDEEKPDAAVSSFEDVLADLRERWPWAMPHKLIIGLEEAQFVKGLVNLVRFVNHHPIGYFQCCRIALFMTALDGTFEQKPWPEVFDALPLCKTFHKSEMAICMCCGRLQAPYSRRDTEEKALILTGKEDKYSACCWQCLSCPRDKRPCHLFSRVCES